MARADGQEQDGEALRQRLSRLSEASLRINESLDLDTVLQEVLDSARTLTEARYGVIILIDETGQPEEVLTSGLTPEETQRLLNVPHAAWFIEHLGSIPGPLRVPDLLSHIRGLGLSDPGLPVSAGAFLAAPVRHLGECVANVYLVKQEPGLEFSSEDEETLVMFASQAALVIANARRHREEQRARTGLETLVDTSPVGVVVFDARNGEVTSLNREARRIVADLLPPDGSWEEVLRTLSFKRSDGRVVSLRELPLAQALNTSETVRAEEITIELPDGRSVTTLINATPIHSEQGIESFVVTLQDMTPLQELERLRAEFLAMVSHELRTPLTSVKGSIATLLDPSAALSPAETLQFHRIIAVQADRMRELISDLLDVAHIETGTLSISPLPTEVAALVGEARNAFLSGGGRNELDVDLPADLPWIMADRLRIVQVLGNLLSNAARHSQEWSTIRVKAVRDGPYVAVSVSDKGRGMAPDSIPHLFKKFTRLDGGDPMHETPGSGLGLAVCKGIVEAHGGRIWADSGGPGLGARFTFTIPSVEESVAGVVSAPPQPSARSPRQVERTRVLAVDDDPQALKYIRDALARAGYEPIMASVAEEALRLMEEQKPHLVLLDLMLPGTDGIELMQDMLTIADVPIIFVSAYGQDQIVAQAFDMGAVDYVVKPFSPTELAARIRASLRRRAVSEPSKPYAVRDLAINYAEREVTLAGRPVRLTPIEYRMLAELSANAGRVLTYAHLLQHVWGPGNDGDVRPMRTVISSLRNKLNDNADAPSYIFTEPRIGYGMPRAVEP